MPELIIPIIRLGPSLCAVPSQDNHNSECNESETAETLSDSSKQTHPLSIHSFISQSFSSSSYHLANNNSIMPTTTQSSHLCSHPLKWHHIHQYMNYAIIRNDPSVHRYHSSSTWDTCQQIKLIPTSRQKAADQTMATNIIAALVHHHHQWQPIPSGQREREIGMHTGIN